MIKSCYDCSFCTVSKNQNPKGDYDRYIVTNSHGAIIAWGLTLMAAEMEKTACHTRFLRPRVNTNGIPVSNFDDSASHYTNIHSAAFGQESEEKTC